MTKWVRQFRNTMKQEVEKAREEATKGRRPYHLPMYKPYYWVQSALEDNRLTREQREHSVKEIEKIYDETIDRLLDIIEEFDNEEFRTVDKKYRDRVNQRVQETNEIRAWMYEEGDLFEWIKERLEEVVMRTEFSSVSKKIYDLLEKASLEEIHQCVMLVTDFADRYNLESSFYKLRDKDYLQKTLDTYQR